MNLNTEILRSVSSHSCGLSQKKGKDHHHGTRSSPLLENGETPSVGTQKLDAQRVHNTHNKGK